MKVELSYKGRGILLKRNCFWTFFKVKGIFLMNDPPSKTSILIFFCLFFTTSLSWTSAFFIKWCQHVPVVKSSVTIRIVLRSSTDKWLYPLLHCLNLRHATMLGGCSFLLRFFVQFSPKSCSLLSMWRFVGHVVY